MINASLLAMLTNKASTLEPVAGSVLHIDGRDGLYNSSTYERLDTNAEANSFYVYDRATNSYRLYQVNINPYLYGRDNGNGLIEFVQRGSDTTHGGLQMLGNMPGIRTIEFSVAVNAVNININVTRTFILKTGNYYAVAYPSDGIYTPYLVGAASVAAKYVIADTNVNHYVVTIEDDKKRRLYRNGVLVATSTSTYNVFTSTEIISCLTSAAATPIGTVIEKLASVRMYTTTLTTTQIAQNYAYEQSIGRVL